MMMSGPLLSKYWQRQRVPKKFRYADSNGLLQNWNITNIVSDSDYRSFKIKLPIFDSYQTK
jgi:hypothetical protein